jgi:hypothetical protein
VKLASGRRLKLALVAVASQVATLVTRGLQALGRRALVTLVVVLVVAIPAAAAAAAVSLVVILGVKPRSRAKTGSKPWQAGVEGLRRVWEVPVGGNGCSCRSARVPRRRRHRLLQRRQHRHRSRQLS